ncbi:site-specific integrase [Aliiruegeria sabulilitoris]|uniref:site-specific integrase n=1 Tax=Aliiruegeria sabulilitoris TaxID=1510458 RepID=UPI0008365189|nr:site-specific integrase [Aliiruegeria sabulilitoris]NDR57912.1 site-specific integrase [Pseudoruegeria sp. M32A2M]
MNQYATITAPELTMADVLRAVDRDPDLSATRRRDLRSDVAAVARWLDRAPASLKADAASIRALVDGLHHVQIGVSEKRLRNAISNVGAAIKLAAAAPSPKGRTPYRTPAWKALLASCGKDWERYRLAGLATYCSERGIDEADVDDAVIQSYRDHLDRQDLRKNPDKACKMTVQTWNRLIDQGTAPYLQRLTPSRSDKNWSIPLSEFPETFQADLEQWLARLAKVDLLADDGPPKPLRPQSIDNIRVQVRHAASALVLSGVSKDAIRALSFLTDRENFKTILRFFIDRNAGAVPTWLHGIASKLVAIARYHVKLPAEELEALVAIKARVKVSRHGLTEKNKLRLGQFEDPRNVELLMLLPGAVVQRVQSRSEPSRWDGLDVMYALAVEILLSVPMRRSNLAELDAERHFVWRGHGAGRHAALMIPGSDVKNGVAIEGDLSADTSRLLRLYMNNYRHLVSDDPGNWLFPKASGGGHRASSSLATQVSQFIRREIGLKVNAHLFRHLSGMLYLMRHPGHYETVRQMLGHKSVDTTISFYTSTESKWALKLYDKNVLQDWRRQNGAS